MDVQSAVRLLDEAREEASGKRVGAKSPFQVLAELEHAILKANTLLGRTMPGNGDTLMFLRSFAKAGSQWLQCAQGYECLPDEKSAGVFLSPGDSQKRREWISDRVRFCANHAASAYEKSSGGDPELLWLGLEMRVVCLTSLVSVALRGGFPSRGSLRQSDNPDLMKMVTSLLSVAMGLDKAKDPNELRPWCLGAIGVVLDLLGDYRATHTLSCASSVQVADISMGLDLILNSLNGLSESRIPSELDRVEEILSASGPPFSAERDALLSRAIPALERLAALEIFAQRPHRTLQIVHAIHRFTYGRSLRGGIPTLHILLNGNRLIGVLEQPDGQLHVSQAELPSEILERNWNLARDGNVSGIEILISDLSDELNEFLSEEHLLQCQQLRINPLGLAGWIPWASLRLGDLALVTKFDLTFLGTGAGEGETQMPDLLILDTVFEAASERVLAAWRKAGLLEEQIIRFDSSRDRADVSVKTLLDRIGASKSILFFTHGASDVLDVGRTNIPIAKGDRLDLRTIVELPGSLSKEFVLVGCHTGRPNPFIHGRTLADAFVATEASPVIATLWQIQADVGARFVEDFLGDLFVSSPMSHTKSWRKNLENSDLYAAFICLV